MLNALCGRAFYGETTGTIHVNGQETTIEDHKDMVGFVPQVRFFILYFRSSSFPFLSEVNATENNLDELYFCGGRTSCNVYLF